MELRAVTSIHHLLIKFPTPHGVGEVKGDQQEARQCYHQAVKVASKPSQFSIVDQWPSHEGPLNDTIDPRSTDEKGTSGPTEDLVDLPVDDKEPSKVLKIGKNLSNETQKMISEFLKQNLDVFAWAHSEPRREGNIMSYCLNIDLNRKPVRQKRRAMDLERY